MADKFSKLCYNHRDLLQYFLFIIFHIIYMIILSYSIILYDAKNDKKEEILLQVLVVITNSRMFRVL